MHLTRRVLVHGGIALIWAILAVPAWFWWRDSVLFVIIASIFANVYAAVSALEAADDTKVMQRLDKQDRQLNRLEQLIKKSCADSTRGPVEGVS